VASNQYQAASPSQRRGGLGEDIAARHLQEAGLHVLARNLRFPVGELDLICRDGDVLVFVEVRTRRNATQVHPLQTIGRRKQRRLIRAAQAFLQEHDPGAQLACRFDVVAVLLEGEQPRIEWLPHAFWL